MILAITGASGFLGEATVRQALAQGHTVRALTRQAAGSLPASWRGQAGLSHHQVSLHDPAALASALGGADAVIHLAAVMRGSESEHQHGTVEATRALIATMQRVGVRRLVGVSSFSVYGTAQMADGAVLDEMSPLEASPGHRDAYARAKLAQEALFRDAASTLSVFIARPGIVYGPEHYAFPAIGQGLGPAWLAIGSAAELPTVHVESCADALLLAATGTATGVVNLVDDYRPSAAEYRRVVLPRSGRVRLVLHFPLWLLMALATIASGLNGVLGHRLPLPGLLRPATLRARFKPLRYDNTLARTRLGWQPARCAP
jgi:nucleoside-diphosphate-sugar epimerase